VILYLIRKVTPLKAVILAGGFATRLRPLSCSRPKTLFPIVNKPLLEWIFQGLAESNVQEAILAVNALTQFYIKQHKPLKHGLKIRYSIDPPKMPLGTAGPVKAAEKLLGHDEPFVVLNGDIFADINYRELIDSHIKTGALATIALCKVEDPCRYGVAELGEGNCIKRFVEKPAKGEAPTNLINAGVYVLSPKVLDYIAKKKHVSMEREIFPVLAKERKLYGHMVHGLWMDIGKPEEYLETNKIILDKTAAKSSRHRGQFETKNPIALDKGVIVCEKSIIGPYAIIGKNTTVGKNTQISNSVVFPHAKIGDSTIIEGAIIGEGAVIGNNVNVSAGCIIADHAKINDNLSLKGKLAVCPAKELSENVLKRDIVC
jgi:mannose-1-phosphate guanylyltransferase